MTELGRTAKRRRAEPSSGCVRPERRFVSLVVACGVATAIFGGCRDASSSGQSTDATATPPRAGRYGTLRDFVLFELDRPDGSLRSLFVDRFEVTRGDWREFAATDSGRAVQAEHAATFGDAALPVGLVSLRQAREFAVWRFGRLPRAEEWHASARGRYNFPWGAKADATRANTAELGLFAPTPVGTFESGRRALGHGQPYDFVGNVSEWTETVPVDWCMSDDRTASSLSLEYSVGHRLAVASPALAVWQPLPGLLPALTAVVPQSAAVPRVVVGADFQSPMLRIKTQVYLPDEHVLGGDRRDRTGIRIVAEPAELVAALCAVEVAPTAIELEQLVRFVRRRGHRAALARAFRELPAERRGMGPVGSWLQQQLGP
ncbi:MAG: SUMF1/EgtB/PvdO family nonheme iron enzyme [bacterium]|nr:SUMF1/EgtB/PvdO family nonheme iron enzyme [bacterium]